MPHSHTRDETFFAYLLLQFVDGAFVGIGPVIVGAASFLEGEGLFDARLHVIVILQLLVVPDKAAFPPRG